MFKPMWIMFYCVCIGCKYKVFEFFTQTSPFCSIHNLMGKNDHLFTVTILHIKFSLYLQRLWENTTTYFLFQTYLIFRSKILGLNEFMLLVMRPARLYDSLPTVLCFIKWSAPHVMQPLVRGTLPRCAGGHKPDRWISTLASVTSYCSVEIKTWSMSAPWEDLNCDMALIIPTLG